jgi:hypothetical protein
MKAGFGQPIRLSRKSRLIMSSVNSRKRLFKIQCFEMCDRTDVDVIWMSFDGVCRRHLGQCGASQRTSKTTIFSSFTSRMKCFLPHSKHPSFKLDNLQASRCPTRDLETIHSNKSTHSLPVPQTALQVTVPISFLRPASPRR